MGFFKHVCFLMWKNWILQKRRVRMTVLEICLPLLFAVILILLRNVTKSPQESSPLDYEQKPVNVEFSPYINRILYAPTTPAVDAIMKDVMTDLEKNGSYIKCTGLASESEVLKHEIEFWTFAIIFKYEAGTPDTLPERMGVVLRHGRDTRARWRTDKSYVANLNFASGEDEHPYIDSGFLILQTKISKAIIKSWNRESEHFLNKTKIEIEPMPKPRHLDDHLASILAIAMPLFVLLSFIISAIYTTNNIVYERENGLKESMKLMGLHGAAHWVSWFLTTLLKLSITIFIYVLLICTSFSKNGPVLFKSDPVLIVIFLLLYAVTVISFSFMISVFVQKANVAAILAGVAFIVMYSPSFKFDLYEETSATQKFAISLLFNVAMDFGCKIISLFEKSGVGLQWSNFNEPITGSGEFAFSSVVIMLVVDSFIYFIVTWYVGSINPGAFGLPEPWYFPFTRQYWCTTRYQVCSFEMGTSHKCKHFEKDPTGMRAGVIVKALRKVFGKKSKSVIAVNNMHLTMYEGQITALLGHNGAGKTTTLSILTGFIPPTSGTAIVNGYDIRTDIAAVRRSLGLCPQHNILFDTLTVEEHLRFFAQLKGVSRKRLKYEVASIIEDIGLDIKRNELSRTLSGGQKRKLAVGIALIGNSKIVILDEPTSGVDPSSRRHTWDLLQRNKEGRTQVLTTHFMDEADVLGDRIAIMVEGDVKCCGTSHFLKKLYGAGYHLVIVKEPHCDVDAVTSLIRNFIPTSKLESEINTEITYLLPEDNSHAFAPLLTQIENKKQRLGILNFGASATTMEEVFLKVVENSEKEECCHHNEGLDISELNSESESSSSNVKENGSRRKEKCLDYNEGYVKKTGLILLLYRLYAVTFKKAYYSWRNMKITFTQIAVPAICIMAALIYENHALKPVDEKLLKLDLYPFVSGKIPYSSGSSSSSLAKNLSESYASLFTGNFKSEYIQENHSLSKYLLSKAEEIGTNAFDRKYIIAAEFLDVNDSVIVRGYYNSDTYHGTAISLNYLMNAIANYASSGKEIVIMNHPLIIQEDIYDYVIFNGANLTGFLIGFILSCGMAFLSATFVYSLISERSVGSKQLQTISGAGPFVYWLSSLIWDYINYFIAIMIVLVVFAAFQTEAYVTDNRLGIVLLIFLCYGWSVLPFMYLLQLMFKSPVTGIAVMIVFNILSGLTTNLIVFVLRMMSVKPSDLPETVDDWFIILSPHHCLGRAVHDMYLNYMKLKARQPLVENIESSTYHYYKQYYTQLLTRITYYENNDFSWKSPGIGKEVTFMIVQGFVFFFCVFFLEYQIPQQLWYRLSPLLSRRKPEADQQQENEDSDIQNEKQRIHLTSLADLPDALVIRQLYKNYGKIIAVDGISVGVAKKECFGLLGQNGAGKTTVFKMLVGEITMYGGNAYIQTCDMKKNRSKNIGYCPQFDALIDQMTGRETLTMYARLHGIPHRHVNRVVNSLMETLMLGKYANKLVSEYSGGNKRKLSTAVALIGNPALILLDEPSTGMDPAARRQLWNVLSEVRASGKTLILTTHSMEECDALCTRMAIMVNGKFVCLGSPQHLKSKFAQGYTLIARLEPNETRQSLSHSSRLNSQVSYSDFLIDFLQDKFPEAQVFETHEGYAHFQIPSANVSLAEIFETMEYAKTNLYVTDYSVHQTTLEQVFLSFVGSQAVQAEDNKTTIWKRISCCNV